MKVIIQSENQIKYTTEVSINGNNLLLNILFIINLYFINI